jgi:hypothetical protein
MKSLGAIFQNWELFVSSYVSLTWGNRGMGKELVMKKLIYSCAFAVGLAMGLSACTDPYDPGQRAIAGGVFGAGTGAAIGGIAGGGRGAATGALIGGALGAVGGAATTPSPVTTDTAPADPVTTVAPTTGLATMHLATTEMATTDTVTRNTDLMRVGPEDLPVPLQRIAQARRKGKRPD